MYKIFIESTGLASRRLFLKTTSKSRGVQMAKEDKSGENYTEIIVIGWDNRVPIERWTLCETRKGKVWKNLDKMWS